MSRCAVAGTRLLKKNPNPSTLSSTCFGLGGGVCRCPFLVEEVIYPPPFSPFSSSRFSSLRLKNLESLEPPELRAARCGMFGQCLVGLIGVLIVLMRYPEDVDELSHDEVRGYSTTAPERAQAKKARTRRSCRLFLVLTPLCFFLLRSLAERSRFPRLPCLYLKTPAI